MKTDLAKRVEQEKSQYRDFYAALGYSIATWSNVEGALAYVFREAIYPGTHEARPISAFFAVENFRSKLQMTDTTIALGSYPKDVMQQWDATDPDWRGLHERLLSANHIRNKLAHYAVMRFPELKMGRQLRLLPSPSNPSNPSPNPKRPTGGYSLTDLERLPRLFTRLQLSLLGFCDALAGQTKPLLGPDLREPRQKAKAS